MLCFFTMQNVDTKPTISYGHCENQLTCAKALRPVPGTKETLESDMRDWT